MPVISCCFGLEIQFTLLTKHCDDLLSHRWQRRSAAAAPAAVARDTHWQWQNTVSMIAALLSVAQAQAAPAGRRARNKLEPARRWHCHAASTSSLAPARLAPGVARARRDGCHRLGSSRRTASAQPGCQAKSRVQRPRQGRDLGLSNRPLPGELS
jgi:hypothetical protein